MWCRVMAGFRSKCRHWAIRPKSSTNEHTSTYAQMVHNKILVLIFNFFNVFVVLGLIVFSLLALCLSFGHVSFFWILQLTKYGHFKANDNAQCLSDVSCTCHSPANLNNLTHVSHFDLVGYNVHRKHCTFTIFDPFKLQIAIPCI